MPVDKLRQFLGTESAGGILLMAAAVLALLISNSPLYGFYQAVLDLPLVITLGDLGVAKPLFLWINDGLMAVFFLLIGLELKREVLEGELRSASQIGLPAAAALGGFALPALIYAGINWQSPGTMGGWAIPAATDIAFALGVLSLLGSRVPLSLKVFLTTIAIFDDLGAIVVIAIFYTSDLSIGALALAGAGISVLIVLNRFGVTRVAAYIAVGIFVWFFVLKSGVHATLAGVAVALAIPMKDKTGGGSPLTELEHVLHPWVAFFILPVFAFANAGISFTGISRDVLFGPVSLGIASGLFLGKQVGVFGATWLMVRTGLATLPDGMDWRSVYGVALLTGVGFTMSLFIGSLAFEHGEFDYLVATKTGVLAGSITSAAVGYAVLRMLYADRESAVEQVKGP